MPRSRKERLRAAWTGVGPAFLLLLKATVLLSRAGHSFFFFSFLFFSDGCLRPLDPGILGPRFMGDCSSARGVAYKRTQHDLELLASISC